MGDRLELYAMGKGFTWETQNQERDIENVQVIWEKWLSFICNKNYRLVLLYETNIALQLGYLDVHMVSKGLSQKPSTTHVILTGLGAPSLDRKGRLSDVNNLN